MIDSGPYLKSRFSSDPAITAIIDTGDAMRMYPVTAITPNGKDTLTYKLEGDYDYSLSGITHVIEGVDLHHWSKSYGGARKLAKAIFPNLHGYKSSASGPFGGVGGLNVLDCLLVHFEDIYIAITPDQGMFDFFVRYELKYTL